MTGTQASELGRPDVFISHASSELTQAELFADHLCAATSRLIRCFVVRSAEHERIDPGQPWRQRLRETIGQSRVVVALLSPAARESPWVNYELGLADHAGQPIISLDLDPTMPGARDHPAGERQIARLTEADVARVFCLVLEACAERPDIARCAAQASAFCAALKGQHEHIRDITRAEGEHLNLVRARVQAYAVDARLQLNEAPRQRELQYMPRLVEIVSSLHRGDELLAICGDKDLNGVAFDYMNENTRAANRGVRVHRIYVEPERGFTLPELQIIDCHLQWSCEPQCQLRVSIVVGDRAQLARRRHQLPEGFGLVVPAGDRHEVFIHYGLHDDNRTARRFDQLLTERVYRDIHTSIASLAEAVDLEKWLTRNNWSQLDQHDWLEYPHAKRRSVRELVERMFPSCGPASP